LELGAKGIRSSLRCATGELPDLREESAAVLTDIIIYYVAAVVLIWVGQIALVQIINVRERLGEQKLRDMGVTDEEAAAPYIDSYLRTNSIIRMLFKIIILIVLGYGAWYFGSRHDGWWWVFWLMFAYNLISALYTSAALDLPAILDPASVRKNPDAFNPEPRQYR
jgi:hypothetical protein